MDKYLKNVLGIFLYVIISSLFVVFYSCGDDPVSSPESEHLEAEGLVLKDTTNNVILKYFKGALTPGKDTINVPNMMNTSVLSVIFLDSNQVELPPEEDPDHTLGFDTYGSTKFSVTKVTGQQWKIFMSGLAPGNDSVKFQVLHEGHADFTTIAIPVRVFNITQ